MDTLHNLKHKNLITTCFMLATIMQVMDTTIANVALPHIQGALGASRDQIIWVLTSYIVASAVATPFVGWLTCKLGVRSTLLSCICGFTLASFLCGMAGSMGQMVAFRLLQGLFGAALIPLSQTILLDINPREKHGQAMAIWGMGIMVAPILGPIIGGCITENYSWRWIFYINAPIGVISFLGLYIYLPNFGKKETTFDFWGFILCSTFIAALQIMLDRGEQKDWFESKEIIAYLIVFITGFITFVVHSRKKRNPFIPIQIFSDRNYLISNILIFFIGIILFSAMAITPQLLQTLAGYDVISSGFMIAPRGIGTMIAMIIVGKLVNRVNVKLLIGFGLILSAMALHMMTQITLDAIQDMVLWSGIIQGFGFGFIFVPISSICFTTIRPDLRAQASSVYSLVRNIGGAIGISSVIFIISYYTRFNHALLSEFVVSGSKNMQAYTYLLPMKGWLERILFIDMEVTKQATLIGYLNAFKICMLLNLAVIPLIFLLKSDKGTKHIVEIAEV